MKAAPGHEVYALTADNLAAWKKTPSLTKSWAESVAQNGADPHTVMAELQASLANTGRGFEVRC